MLSDVTWRKMPTDMLTNETMTYIESQMPKGFEYAPFMFYQAALKKADDDGSFDLEDGIVFARLMRVPDVKLVFQIAILMVKRGIIAQVQKGSNLCLLTDWEYSKGTQTRTMAERRALVSRKIEAERAHRTEVEFVAMPSSDNAPESPVFDDKIQENVDKNGFDDKIQKNVDKNTNSGKKGSSEVSLEREREREREEKENTHTEREIESVRGREKDASASAEPYMGSAPAPAETEEALATDYKEPETETETDVTAVVPEFSTVNLAAEAISTANSEEQKESGVLTDFEAVCAFLESFFKTNCFGYDERRGKKTVQIIAEKIMALSGKGNSPQRIAEVCCEAFKKMHDEPGQWKDIPLQPVYMAKDGVWAHILTFAGKKLTKKGSKNNTFFENAKKCQEAADEERAQLIAMTEGEYRKYGIDPADPNRVQKLMIKKRPQMADDAVLTDEQLEGSVF